MVTTDRKGSECYEAESRDEGAVMSRRGQGKNGFVRSARHLRRERHETGCDLQKGSPFAEATLRHHSRKRLKHYDLPKVWPGALVEGAKQMGWQLN